jgi:uncharacterized protein
VRDQQLTWEQVNTWRLELHQTFDHAYRRTTLPERPNYDAANDLLIRARRSMVETLP